MLAAYNGYCSLTGPSRMTERLRARLAQGPATVNVLITAKFPPEEFHMRGVEGTNPATSRVTTGSTG